MFRLTVFFSFLLFCAVQTSLTLTNCVTMNGQVRPVVLDEGLWYVVLRLGRVISSSISVATDYVANAILCVNMAKDLIHDIGVEDIRHLLCML